MPWQCLRGGSQRQGSERAAPCRGGVTAPGRRRRRRRPPGRGGRETGVVAVLPGDGARGRRSGARRRRRRRPFDRRAPPAAWTPATRPFDRRRGSSGDGSRVTQSRGVRSPIPTLVPNRPEPIVEPFGPYSFTTGESLENCSHWPINGVNPSQDTHRLSAGIFSRRSCFGHDFCIVTPPGCTLSCTPREIPRLGVRSGVRLARIGHRLANALAAGTGNRYLRVGWRLGALASGRTRTGLEQHGRTVWR
jgi:hypothetical protein